MTSPDPKPPYGEWTFYIVLFLGVFVFTTTLAVGIPAHIKARQYLKEAEYNLQKADEYRELRERTLEQYQADRAKVEALIEEHSD